MVDGRPLHFVHFFEDDQRLVGAVTDFLSRGLNSGQSVVVIATEPHRLAIGACLAGLGYDVDEVLRQDRMAFVDAREALSRFMAGGIPDEALFHATVGTLIEARLRGSGPGGLRVYGEMVDVLWKDGLPEAAIRLEELWRDLTARHRFALLCAYTMGNFYGEAPWGTEGDSSGTQPSTGAMTGRPLEQRALALEAEVQQRKRLEAALRRSLADRRRVEVELRQAEHDLWEFLESAVEGLHWVGPDGAILWANQATLDLLGYGAAEFVGHSIAEFHVDPAAIEDMLERLRRGETLRGREATLRRKDGALTHVVIDANGLWRDGQFVHSRWFARDITERKLAEQALQESQDRLRIALEAGRMGAWEWDITTNRVLWSPELERLHGLAPGAFDGTFQAYLKDVHPDDRAVVEASIARTLEERRDHHVEYRLQMPDGETRWVEGRGQLFCDQTGRPVRLVGVCQDITDERRQRQALETLAAEARESEARFRALADSAPVMIWVDGADGGCEFVNKAYLDFFGATLDEVRGFGWNQRVHPDDADAYLRAFLTAFAAREPFRAEVRLQAANGEYRWCESYALPRYTDAGEFLGYVGVSPDITNRKVAEEAVRTSEQRAREQARITEKLNQVGAAVASTLDRDSILQTVTDLATELTAAEFGAFFQSVTDSQPDGEYLLYTLSGAPKEAFANFPKPRATALFGPTFRGEAAVIRLDDVTADSRYGRNAPYHGMPAGHLPVRSYLAVPVKARSGEVLGGLFFGHSRVGVFTPQHERLVEGAAAWASLALENARLYAHAERAGRAREEFLSIASHELRNPLNAVQLQLVGLHRAAERQEATVSRDWVCERVGQATEDVARLVGLVHNLLDVSRITAGRLELEPEDIELDAVLRSVAGRFRHQLRKGQLTLDLPCVRGTWDRLRLDQIASNLLSNAIAYGQGKPIEISLRADSEMAYLSVCDHGIGIDEAQQKRLFQRFERAVSHSQYAGFGLGLWITRQIVHAMGGHISVASQPGAGSAFTVALPRRPGSANARGDDPPRT
jgi:PAS domain S-box-containing protein